MVRLSALSTGRLYPPTKDPWYSFLLHSVVGRIKSMNNLKYPTGNQTHDLPDCSAVHQPTALPYIAQFQNVSPGVKRPGHQVSNSPPSREKVSKGWRYASTPHICLHVVQRWICLCLLRVDHASISFNYVRNLENSVLYSFNSFFLSFFLSLTSFYLPSLGVEGYCFMWSHTVTQSESEGLLWTRDRPVAETSTWQHTTLTTN
jgi:hypothetical protein